MSIQDSRARISRILSGSTSDLACVVDMLDNMLERSHGAADPPSAFVPPLSAPECRKKTADIDLSKSAPSVPRASTNDPLLSAARLAATRRPSSSTQLTPLSGSSSMFMVPRRETSAAGVSSAVQRPLSVESTTSTSSSSSAGSSLPRTGMAWRLMDAPVSRSVSASSASRRLAWRLVEGSTSSEDTMQSSQRMSKISKSSSSGSGDSGLSSPVIYPSSLEIRHHRYTDPSLSYLDRVVAEVLETEADYVHDLQEIIEGYMKYWQQHPPTVFAHESTSLLFGNIMDIFRCNSDFLLSLELCNCDPLRVAESFVQHGGRFSVYVDYCTNYPRTVSVLTELMSSEMTSRPFRTRQTVLGHALPLGSYLLKPVQRILKYHLLLQNMKSGLESSGGDTVSVRAALDKMTTLAEHINEMKRRHEHAVRVQEIQSLLYGWQGADLTTFGELVAEGMFRMYRAKASRHMFLFDRMLLITKRREDAALTYKTHIMCSNLMLIESVPGEPLCFHVIPFDNPRLQYTLQARTKDQKRAWTLQLKRAILESYNAVIPYHARELVLKLGQDKDGVDDVRRRGSRRQHLAPEYLERRRGGVKRSPSFNQRFGLRSRDRSSDADQQSEADLSEGLRKSSKSYSETTRRCGLLGLRRKSAPSSPVAAVRGITAQSPEGPASLDVECSMPDENRCDKESLQSIVEQLVMQNMEFRRILNRPRRGVRRQCSSSSMLTQTERTAADSKAGEETDTDWEQEAAVAGDAGSPNFTACPEDGSGGGGGEADTSNKSALSIANYEDTQYVSFMDYGHTASQLTKPRFAGDSGRVESRLSLHRTVSDPCRRMARSVSRFPQLGHGELTHMLASLRRKAALKRTASSRHMEPASGSCGEGRGGIASRLPYLTPQLSKRAERLAGAFRRSGSLGRPLASSRSGAPGDGLMNSSCTSSLAGSCDSLPQLPACRIYGPVVSQGSLRQMVGTVRSRLSRLKQHNQHRGHGIADPGRLTTQLSDPGYSTTSRLEDSTTADQSRSRLLHILARSLKERIASLVPDDTESEMEGSASRSTRAGDHRPCSTLSGLSESTSCSSASSGVATESSRTRGAGSSDGEGSLGSFYEQRLDVLEDSDLCRDSAIYSDPDDLPLQDRPRDECPLKKVPPPVAEKPSPRTNPASIRERLRSLQQSVRGEVMQPVAPSVDAVLSIGERRRRLERWRSGSRGEESETSSQHSTSTLNTVIDGRSCSPVRNTALATGWVKQVIGKLQGESSC